MKFFSKITSMSYWATAVLTVAFFSVYNMNAAQTELSRSPDVAQRIREKRLSTEQAFQSTLKKLSTDQRFFDATKSVFGCEALLNPNFSDKQNLHKTGPEALKLIDWLQNNKLEAVDTSVLRKKLNKTFYFGFQGLIINLDLPQEKTKDVLIILAQLYNFKSGANEPFSTTLSRGYLNISLAQLQQNVGLREVIEKLKTDLLKIKKENPTCEMSEEVISLFTQNLLEALTSTQTAAQSQSAKQPGDKDVAAFSARINELSQTIDALNHQNLVTPDGSAEEQNKLSIVRRITYMFKAFIMWIVNLFKSNPQVADHKTKAGIIHRTAQMFKAFISGILNLVKSVLKGAYLWIIAPIVLIVLLVVYYAVSSLQSGVSGLNDHITTILNTLVGPIGTMASFARQNLDKIKNPYQAAFATATVLGMAGTTIYAPFVTVASSIVSWVAVGGGAFFGWPLLRGMWPF